MRAFMSTLEYVDPAASGPLRDCRSSHLWPQPGDDERALAEARRILAETRPGLNCPIQACLSAQRTRATPVRWLSEGFGALAESLAAFVEG